MSYISEDYSFHIVGEYTHYRDHYINFVGNGLRNSDLKVYPTGRLKMCITAPLWQQAFRWFREKYKLYGFVSDDMFGKYQDKILYIHPEDKYGCERFLIKKDHISYTLDFEEAQLACLRELIKIVKEKYQP